MQAGGRALIAGALIMASVRAPAHAEGASRLKLLEAEHEPAGSRAELGPHDLEALRAAVAKDPKDRAARFALVRGLQRANQLAEALAAARDWRAVDAYNLVVVRLLGDIYSELGDKPKARPVSIISCCSKFISPDTQHGLYWLVTP